MSEATKESDKKLRQLVKEAMARFDALSPEEQRAHRRAQRESFVRAMTTPCEHGVMDFEQCAECRSPDAQLIGGGTGSVFKETPDAE